MMFKFIVMALSHSDMALNISNDNYKIYDFNSKIKILANFKQ